MDDWINSAIYQKANNAWVQILEQNLAGQKEIIKRIKSLKKEELYRREKMMNWIVER